MWELNGGRKRREEEKREGKGMVLDSLGVRLLTGSGLATVNHRAAGGIYWKIYLFFSFERGSGGLELKLKYLLFLFLAHLVPKIRGEGYCDTVTA